MPGLNLQPQSKRPRVTDPNRFDTVTHETDARGRVRGTNLFRAHVKDGNTFYERPVGSGNLFHENNQPAGRVEVTKDKRGVIVGKKFDFEAKHKSYTPALDAQTEMEQKLMDMEAKNAAMAKELAAIKQEQMIGANRHVVGDEVHANSAAGSAAPQSQDGISRSVKDSPIGARLTEPKSSSTPVDPASGHAVPVSPTAEAIRAQAGKEQAARPAPPTPANVHAQRAAEEAKKKL